MNVLLTVLDDYVVPFIYRTLHYAVVAGLVGLLVYGAIALPRVM